MTFYKYQIKYIVIKSATQIYDDVPSNYFQKHIFNCNEQNIVKYATQMQQGEKKCNYLIVISLCPAKKKG